MLAFAIDIGGTSIRFAIIDTAAPPASAIIESQKFATPPGGDATALAAMIRDAASRLLRGREIPVGVAIPGIRDESDRMITAVNLPALAGIDLRALFHTATGRDAAIQSDAICAAIAQLAARALPPPDAARSRRYAYLSIGTGIGGAVLLDGVPVAHTRGGAGHFGHLIVDSSLDAPLCGCGARGCLEAVVAGAAGARVPAGVRARALAIGLLHVANIYAPDVIALGGGVIDANPALVPAAAAAFAALGCKLPGEVRIELAPLPGDQAGLIGAAWMTEKKR